MESYVLFCRLISSKQMGGQSKNRLLSLQTYSSRSISPQSRCL